MITIPIPYRPERLWKETIHPALESHRFSVIVAHRRFGKTVGTVNHMVKMAVQNQRWAPQYAYVAPFRNQAKSIAWSYLKYYTHVIPGVIVNEGDLYVEIPSLYKGAPGARIRIIGADHPDALRGTYWDGVILDEYAQIKPELWNEVINPAIADRLGWVIFVGTPKGQNQFYEIYQKALKSPDWYACMYRADESGVFDEGGRYGPAELERMKRDMSADAVRQELYCDFTASAYNVLITIDLVSKAVERNYQAEELRGAPVVLGVDVARFGNDRSVIFRRQGLMAYEPIVYGDIDNMTLAARVMELSDRYKAQAVFIDAGRGEGVIDRCRQLGYDVVEVNFGAQATQKGKYINKRSEMWDDMKKWLEAGGCLPQNAELKTELTTPEYDFDAANRMRLESKEKIKERMGASPDIADALALTFAYPVHPNVQWGGRDVCNTSYDPFA